MRLLWEICFSKGRNAGLCYIWRDERTSDVKESRAWTACEGYVSTGILLPRLTPSQVVEYIQQVPAEGRSVVAEMEAAGAQRSGGAGSPERSEKTKKASATEEELRLTTQARA